MEIPWPGELNCYVASGVNSPWIKCIASSISVAPGA